MGKSWMKTVTIDGKLYRRSDRTGNLYRISDCKSIVYRGPDDSFPIFERLDYPGTPDLNSLFSCVDYNGFIMLLSKVAQMTSSINPDTFYNNISRDPPPVLENLYEEWYKDRDVKSLYSNPLYVHETIHCNLHVTCSFGKKGNVDRNAPLDYLLRNFHHLGLHDKNIKILDLGSGLGLTSLFMAKFMPKATVYYNEINESSRKIFKRLLDISGLKNVVMIKNESELPEKLDAVVAIEVVEHVPDSEFNTGAPFPWLDKFINRIKSGGYLMHRTMWTSEWKQPTLGHFQKYKFDNDLVEKKSKTCKEFKKGFDNAIKRRKYTLLNSGGKGKTRWSWRGTPVFAFEKI